jgi:hypothetical protein
MEKELTRAELDRLDFVHNTIHQMLCDLAGREIEWDMEPIGEISDIAEELICNQLKLMTEQEFAPFLEE